MATTDPTGPGRARTILALNSHGAWWLEPDGHFVSAPFVDHGGTPLLLVRRADAEMLLEQDRLSVTMRGPGSLGTLHLVGRPRLPRTDEAHGELLSYRRDHAECGPGCGSYGTVPVPVEVGGVAVSVPGGRELTPLTLMAYLSAQADPWAVAAHAVAEHMGVAHAPEVLELAAQAIGLPVVDILSATISEITTDAVVISTIDRRGAADVEIRFGRRLRSAEDLPDELHRLMSTTGTPGAR